MPSIQRNYCNQYDKPKRLINIVLLALVSAQLQWGSLRALIPAVEGSPFGIHMVRSPESIVAPQGDEVVFECQLNLEPDYLKWRFRPFNSEPNIDKYIDINSNDIYNITNDDKKSSKLRVYVRDDTIGEYQCVSWFGSAALTSVTARLTLATISLENEDERPPADQVIRWHVSPQNSVLIKCGNVTSIPPPSWSFYKNNIPVSDTVPQLPSGALILKSVSPSDSGQYSCRATNAIAAMDRNIPVKIELSVKNLPRSAPQFLVEPPRKISVRPEQTVVLECGGIGNPPPTAVWSRPDMDIPHSRATKLPYGLQIINVSNQDQGNYVCRLDNGIAPVLVRTVRLEVLEPPVIVKGPASTSTNESNSLTLECVAKGSPKPDIYWMINGADTRWDSAAKHENGKLSIKSVEKRHAGIVQCFARNSVGEANSGNILEVIPKQIPGEVGKKPLGPFPTKPPYESGKTSKGRKKHKMPNMIPPSRPNVTRLNDDSVMVRWYVPKNDGLPIQFFKVQYRMLGDPERNIPRENWQTVTDDIPYGKRDRSMEGVKNFTTAVVGLKPNRYYRFRILAVYSNNDNKEGNSSGKFLLQAASQLGITRNHLPTPKITKIEGISETEILLHWTLPDNKSTPIDGFYAYFRPASTAGEYTKATIDGMDTRQFKIDMLEIGTAYEFKLQSFTASAASDFSSIITGKTMKPSTPPPTITPTVVAASESSQDDNSMFLVIAGGVVVGLLLLVGVVVVYCVKRQKNTQREDENKSNLEHQKSSHPMNGINRMNITPNPLAQEGDTVSKNRNVMELRFMPTSNNAATAPGTPIAGHHQMQTGGSGGTSGSSGSGGGSGVGLVPPPVPPHHHYQQQQQPFHHQHQMHPNTAALPPSSPIMLHKQHHQVPAAGGGMSPQNNNQMSHHMNHFQTPAQGLDSHSGRRTLERSARDLHYVPPSPHPHDSVDGVIPTRIPSLRRTRRTSGSTTNHNSSHTSLGIPSSPRVQRSPMPVRAAPIKRNRLGSHTENMSSGSLNSIEV
ncbi:interference hedgehog isoform X3 [Hermetia illucens]|uniref:interference hedgehog isoform X3 n=1 Tax=Hermetia illucens TaxID=343691 RepID=UPI0018CC10F4|nr:interference hedgehog isoform X3 [Hermetia illucens]